MCGGMPVFLRMIRSGCRITAKGRVEGVGNMHVWATGCGGRSSIFSDSRCNPVSFACCTLAGVAGFLTPSS